MPASWRAAHPGLDEENHKRLSTCALSSAKSRIHAGSRVMLPYQRDDKTRLVVPSAAGQLLDQGLCEFLDAC